ncbi:MAG: hypothetical protein IPK96_16490 [Flammeovirgaceae bacterium]|nr:hypothetical protein [Flammeovirgaceae bacterium]
MRTIAIILFNLSSLIVFAQSDKLTLDQTLGVALRNNKGIQAASYEVEYQKQLKKTSFDLPKTDITLMRGQYNSYAKK